MTGGIGDLLHPRGVPQQAVYDLIGGVYAHVEACEPFVAGGVPQSQIALVVDPELATIRAPPGSAPRAPCSSSSSSSTWSGPTANLDHYEVVLVAETTPVDDALLAKLRTYVAQGGGLIFSGQAGFTEQGEPVLTEQGVAAGGPSPFSHTFLRMAPAVSAGIPDYDHVTYESGYRIEPALAPSRWWGWWSRTSSATSRASRAIPTRRRRNFRRGRRWCATAT